jgi:hypothetical protein
LGLVLAQRVVMPRASPVPAWAVPLGFHLYFLIAGIISGVILNPPILLVVSLTMLALSLYLHRQRASGGAQPLSVTA